MKKSRNNLLLYLVKNLQNSELMERLMINLQGRQQIAYQPVQVENKRRN